MTKLIDVDVKDDYITIALVHSNSLAKLIYKGKDLNKALQVIDNYEDAVLKKVSRMTMKAKTNLCKLIKGDQNETIS